MYFMALVAVANKDIYIVLAATRNLTRSVNKTSAADVLSCNERTKDQ